MHSTKDLRDILNADKITGDIVIIHDENVPGEFINYYSAAFAPKAVISLGDNKKNTDTYLKIISTLASLEFKKNDMLVAVGGGSTTDIAGFVACTYKRGIDFAIIPSTLLSCSSAGVLLLGLAAETALSDPSPTANRGTAGRHAQSGCPVPPVQRPEPCRSGHDTVAARGRTGRRAGNASRVPAR